MTDLPTDAPRFTRVIAVANQKGGVGKSTTTVNVGAWLALAGERVLIVDLDPQANATTGVGVDPHRVAGNIYQILVNDKPMEDAIEATAVKNLYVVPSNIDLAGAEIELVPAFSREQKLKRALEGTKDDFDFVLIDCPPSLGLLTINALAAAQEVLVPIQCEYYALEGLGQLLKNINLIQSNLNPTLQLTGIVLTMYDSRTKLAEQVANEVRGHFPGKVMEQVVPRSVKLSEAPSYGMPIALYDPRSKGAVAYKGVAEQLNRQSKQTKLQGPRSFPQVVHKSVDNPTEVPQADGDREPAPSTIEISESTTQPERDPKDTSNSQYVRKEQL